MKSYVQTCHPQVLEVATGALDSVPEFFKPKLKYPGERSASRKEDSLDAPNGCEPVMQGFLVVHS